MFGALKGQEKRSSPPTRWVRDMKRGRVLLGHPLRLPLEAGKGMSTTPDAAACPEEKGEGGRKGGQAICIGRSQPTPHPTHDHHLF